jgi:hypothetical protein
MGTSKADRERVEAARLWKEQNAAQERERAQEREKAHAQAVDEKTLRLKSLRLTKQAAGRHSGQG